MSRVIICGGRDFDDREFIFSKLDGLDNDYHFSVVITGGASGTDYIAHSWATKRRKEVEVYKADWDEYDKSAGILRNRQMLQYAQPDVVIAFPGGRGTQDMIKIAKKKNVPVIEVEYNGDY
jgi:predicted Rossmann-fold nucleotide-binding protein